MKEKKIILAIESSCDETACALVDEDLNTLSSVVTSQIDVHARFGGVIPEVASRMHVEQISIIVKEAIERSGVTMDDVDYIAYTIGPGLIGSAYRFRCSQDTGLLLQQAADRCAPSQGSHLRQ